MKKITGILLPLTAILIVSCHAPRYIYSASPPNDPGFTAKGESRAAAYYSFGSSRSAELGNGRNNGFDLQGAYALTDHWAVTASYTTRKERDNFSEQAYDYFDSSTIRYKRKAAEFGLGYFLPVDKSKKAFFAAYAGIGPGKFSFVDRGKDDGGLPYERTLKAGYTKWFIQPSVNFFPDENLKLSLISKFSFVSFHNVKSSYTHDEADYYELDALQGRTFNYFEPTFNMQVGFRETPWIKVDGALTLVSRFNNNFYSKLRSRSLNASLGLCFDLSRLKNK